MAEGKAEGKQRKEEKVAQSIVRIAGRDIDGALNIERAMSRVKGIGMNMSHSLSYAIETKLGIPKSKNIGSLSDQQIADIENVIKSPDSAGIPIYMLNKRKDFDTGKDRHYVGNDLTFNTRQDVTREVNLHTWRGYRHQYGQKVRGQRTRSTGRTGATVGVMKKAVKAQQAAAAAASKGEKKEEKK